MVTHYQRIKKISLKDIAVIVILLLFPFLGTAQSQTKIKEYQKDFTTYPYSAPNPVANNTGIYPYFRFDGFTDQPIQKKWKIVELENDFIKVLITPQIGGKIWTAIDKKNGQPFIYNNDVVKFRDIAMRGAWTSGGIEINYGMFGHTPGVATPVNYITKKNSDGSASCVLSLLDLLTDTRWSLEIRLPKDKGYFITKSFWHNETAVYQPYYTWMNMAQKVSDSLQYLFPGNHHLSHSGKIYPWPYDKKNGKDLSIYNQNDFGGSKSYHIIGTYSNYFGAYWEKEDFGMMHYAPRQEKIGKKIFIWGLSRAGMIWEDILTDHAGQYTEMQSGRLYNQNAAKSVYSPFKQFYFMPYSSDTWSEYWYPFQNTEGAIAADLNGVFNFKRKGKNAIVSFSSVSYIQDTLKIYDTAGKLIYRKAVRLKPLQTFKENVTLPNGTIPEKITLAGSVIHLQDSTEKILDRPLKTDTAFDWSSAYGLYLKGKYAAGTRHYKQAEKDINASLKKEPFFIPSLTEKSYLQYRKMNYDSAFHYARKALSINTYHPEANYYYGLAALKLQKKYDALDGFQVATITPQFRSAAYTELSKMKIREGHFKKAGELAEKSLINNKNNVSGLQLRYLSASKLKNKKLWEKCKKEILDLDPLNHFIRFENYWRAKTKENKDAFTNLIRDELPAQTYLNLAIWYHDLGLQKESIAVLEICPQKDDEILYWLAYLNRNNKTFENWLEKAAHGNPHFVFPYRAESAVVMRWALKQTNNWKARYYLSLILNFRGHKMEALSLLKSIDKELSFAPLYVTRARLRASSDTLSILNDYRTAVSIDKKDWRYGKYLADYLLKIKRKEKALEIIKPYYKDNPDNYILGMLYVQSLMLTNHYQTAEKVLKDIHILPYEGATNGHKVYVQIKLMLALQQLQKKHYKKAIEKVNESKKWPEHLGVGQPYENRINNTLQQKIGQFIQETKTTGKLKDKVFANMQKAVTALTK